MGESNEEWGVLASHDSELAEQWDTFDRLPDPGENPALDAFCERKGLSIPALVRVGAKLSDAHVLAFAFDGGIKYRDIVTDRRWSTSGAEWRALKVIRHGADLSSRVLVAEGETDAAKLADSYTADVAIMPAGADVFKPEYAEQLAAYELVLVALDTDTAGERGSNRIIDRLPNAMRFPPPENDWCDSDELPPLPDELDRPGLELLVPAGTLIELEVPEITSWFEHAVLPVGGLLALHGWIKSFKSFMAIDMLSALAQGQDWCCFEPTEEACRVAVIQYEITWPYYRERVSLLRSHARDRDLFDSNFYTWQPMTRPTLRAGNTAAEDHMIAAMVEAGIQVVLIDPIRRAAGTIDINAEAEVRKVLHLFERLQDHGITVVTTHHDNKDSARARGGDPLGMTGSGAFGGDPDTIVSIELPKGESPDSPRRNLNFTLRNAIALPGPRGMEMQEDGRIVYSTTGFGSEDDPDAPEI